MTAFSLFNLLTTGDSSTPSVSKTYPATDLIDYLIKVVAHDACKAKRNTLTSYKVVETARKISEEIKTLIQKVEDDDDEIGSDDIWDQFDQYAAAITPLERYLFSLALVTEKECSQFLPDGQAEVNDLVQSIDDWETQRLELRKLTKLTVEPLTAVLADLDDTILNTEGLHDDNDLFSTLCTAINKHPLVDTDVNQDIAGFITGLKESAKELSIPSQPQPSDALIVANIRCAMLVLGAMDLAKTQSQDQTLKDTAAKLLLAKDVWAKAKEVTELVKNNLTSAGNSGTLISGWTELKTLLEKLGVNLPQEYKNLRKSAHKVRRPYHSRTTFLVSQCRLLAGHFLVVENKTIAKRQPLKEAIEKVQFAIDKAMEHAGSIKKYQSFATAAAAGAPADADDAAAATAAADAFTAAVSQIKSCFGTYGMTQQNEVDSKLATEVGIDVELVGLLNGKFADHTTKQSAPSSGALKVTVKYKTTSTEYPVAMDTQPLRAIRCQLALQHPTDRASLLTMQFKDSNDDDVGLDTKVSTNLDLTLEA